MRRSRDGPARELSVFIPWKVRVDSAQVEAFRDLSCPPMRSSIAASTNIFRRRLFFRFADLKELGAQVVREPEGRRRTIAVARLQRPIAPALLPPVEDGHSGARALRFACQDQEPFAVMSARLSTGLPRACSGDMYAAVPMIIPAAVACRDIVGDGGICIGFTWKSTRDLAPRENEVDLARVLGAARAARVPVGVVVVHQARVPPRKEKGRYAVEQGPAVAIDIFDQRSGLLVYEPEPGHELDVDRLEIRVAGASHIRWRDFVLGTLVGLTPGIVALNLFKHLPLRASITLEPR